MYRNYPKINFFEGVITGHHFWRYGAVLPETNFTFQKFITCLSLLPKQEKSVKYRAKYRTKYHFKNAKSGFSTKRDWICHNVAEIIGEILFLILVVYRSTFRVLLTIFRILFVRNHFSLSRFYPIILTVP